MSILSHLQVPKNRINKCICGVFGDLKPTNQSPVSDTHKKTYAYFNVYCIKINNLKQKMKNNV